MLIAAGSGDPSERGPAEAALKHFSESNLPGYLNGLLSELLDESKPEPARQLAGLLVKNALVARSEAEQTLLTQRWLELAEPVRANIRKMVFVSLSSAQKPVRSTGALVVGALAAIEIPRKMWPGLVEELVKVITKGTDTNFREASFEALGYICEQCGDELQAQSSLILNAIASGMRKEETSNGIKYAATAALANSLEFTKANMANPTERNLILQMVFSATTSEEVKVRVAAYQCLVEMVSLYYELMGPSMVVIFNLTSAALEKEQEPVVLQAIEFWSTVCDVELEILAEAEEAEQLGTTPKRKLQNFAEQALGKLVPMLLVTLTKQSDTLDDDTWIPAMAAGTCLSLFAQVCADKIVPVVLPFVQGNIQNTNWRFREAATLAFGSILDGPDREKLGPLVKGALPVVLTHMKDSNVIVKDTAAWTIGRICNILPETIDADTLPKLMQVLLEGLKEEPKIAANVCWAIHNLAGMVSLDEDDSTSPLSKFFEGLMKSLFIVTERPDVAEGNLLSSAYEAINALIHTAAKDVYPIIQAMLPGLINRLQKTLHSTGLTGEEKEKLNEVQALLCGSLQVIISNKLGMDVINSIADTVMTLFLKVLSSKNATVHEEALMAIGALANRLGVSFGKYMGHFKEFLLLGLKNWKEQHVCVVSVGVVGDLTRALEDKMIPFCDEIMQALLENLQNPNVERVVKPHILSCLGDVALGVGGYFERYLQYAMQFLVTASQVKIENMQLDDYDYLNTLREAVLEAYTGIIQGLSTDGKADLFAEYLGGVGPFFEIIAGEKVPDDEVTKSAAGVVGDLATRLGHNPKVQTLLRLPAILQIVMAACKSENESTKEQGEWAKKSVEKVLSR